MRPFQAFAVSLLLVASACRPSGDTGTSGTTSDAATTDRLYPVLEEGGWGYMNQDGHLVVGPEYDAAWPFSEDLALVQKDGAFGYIDTDGEVAIPLAYQDAWYFSNGLAPVLKDGTWMFIDRQGAVTESGTFDIGELTLGSLETLDLDRVRIGDLYGFRNADGQVVIDPQFEQAWYFVDGLARVSLGGKWGFIDRSGSMVIEPAFDVAWDFDQGLARVKVGERYGYINKAGDYVWAPTS